MYQATSVESRRADCARLLAKYPGAVPIVAQIAKSRGAKPVFVSLAHTATVADLCHEMKCPKGTTLLIEDCTPAPATTLGDLHQCCQADDGFLHVSLLLEKSMGDATAIGCCRAAVEDDGNDDDVAFSICGNVAMTV